MHISFAEFEAATQAQSYPDVLERQWAAGTVVGTHSHPFDASALLVQGEMWLTVDGKTQHLLPGDRFALLRDTLHDERYGPEGATYWVGRRGASA